MTNEIGQLLLMVFGFYVALGAMIAILDRLESSLYDSSDQGQQPKATEGTSPRGTASTTLYSVASTDVAASVTGSPRPARPRPKLDAPWGQVVQLPVAQPLDHRDWSPDGTNHRRAGA